MEGITFRSGDGSCTGVLYRPADAGDDPLPVIVLAHGFSATRLTQYDRRARRLIGAGVAVLDFDSRCVGSSPGEPRQRIHVTDWLCDLRAAVSFARALPGIDGDRVGLFGSSLGGGLAFALATEDPRIRAIALAVPMLDGLIATPAPVGARPRLIGAIAKDALGRRRGQPPVLLPVFGDAVSNAVIQREVDEFYAALDEVEGVQWIAPRQHAHHADLGEWRNQATALELLSLITFRPARKAARIHCPVLAHLGERDRIVPTRLTLRTLRKIPGADIRMLPGGHFDPFYGPGFEQSVQAETDFFRRHLLETQAFAGRETGGSPRSVSV